MPEILNRFANSAMFSLITRASTRSLRPIGSVRAKSTAVDPLYGMQQRKTEAPSWPYVGNPNGFKQVDPTTVKLTAASETMPSFQLPNGDFMPAIGMGTFTGTRHTSAVQAGTMYKTTKMWIRMGGRSIDCAQNYLNEDEIGDAIYECIKDGIVTREELFISSKLNNPYHRKEHVQPAMEKTLLDLRLDYVDMYLMHWPTAFVYVPFNGNVRGFPESYEPDCCTGVTGVAWDPEKFKKSWPPPHLDMGVTIHETWNAMEKLQENGMTRNIGVCNTKVSALHELLCGAKIKPAVVQVECHPYNQQHQLLEFAQMNGIQFQPYSPLGYGAFKKDNEVGVLESPLLGEIGAKYGKSIAETVLRWHIQRGTPTCPFSLRENELRMNLTVGDWELEEEDMEAIKTLDKDFHYLRPESWYGLPLWG